MANVKISALPALSSIQDTTIFACVDTGTTQSVTALKVKNYLGSVSAGSLTGSTLSSSVLNSSLTSLGTIANLTVTNITTNGLTLRNVNFIPVASTATYALSTTTSYNVLVVSNTGLTVTVTLPPSPVDQQLCCFSIASNTVSTLNMTSGPTVVPPFTGTSNVTSGTVYQYVYRASTTTWYRN